MAKKYDEAMKSCLAAIGVSKRYSMCISKQPANSALQKMKRKNHQWRSNGESG